MNLFKELYRTYQDYRDDKWIFNQAIGGIKEYKKRFNKYPKTVIDIGAHRGGFSMYALNKGAKVLAIEASAQNYIKLSSNLSKYDPKQYKIINKAIAANNGTIRKLYIFEKGNSGQRSIAFNNKQKILKRCLTQYVLTIDLNHIFRDNFIKNKLFIDYLKIDIEGSEYEALPISDTTKKLLQYIKFLDIEFHPMLSPFFNKEKMNLPFIDRKRNIVEQYIEFFIDCGFRVNDYKSDNEYKDGFKLCTYNHNINFKKEH